MLPVVLLENWGWLSPVITATVSWALLGIEAAIQTRDLGEKGVFHRVRVGPFRAMDEINRTRTLLTQNNIPATLVKEVPNQQETP